MGGRRLLVYILVDVCEPREDAQICVLFASAGGLAQDVVHRGVCGGRGCGADGWVSVASVCLPISYDS